MPRPVPLCGEALDRFVAGWQRRLADRAEGLRQNDELGFLACRNRPGPPTCTFGRSMEWDPAVHFVFGLDAEPGRGLRLRAVTLDDEVLVGAADVATEHRAQARVIARLLRRGCPAAAR